MELLRALALLALAFAASVSFLIFSHHFIGGFGVCCVCELPFLIFPSASFHWRHKFQSITNSHFSHTVGVRGGGDGEQHVSGSL